MYCCLAVETAQEKYLNMDMCVFVETVLTMFYLQFGVFTVMTAYERTIS